MTVSMADRPPTQADVGPGSVISVRGLSKHFPIKEGVLQRVTGHVRAVDGVDLDIRPGETIGLVGESGCGKTTLGRCIGGLMPPTSGGVYFGLPEPTRRRLDELLALDDRRTPADEEELAGIVRRHRIDAMDKERWRIYRRNCQMVFQDSFSSLNPRHLVKEIVGRPLELHRLATGAALIERVVELLESVGLGSQHLYRYPHQFSGGQRQRISIARALALEPEFIILDEPTSALDVSVQAQILNLLHDLQDQHGLTYLFISHDLNVVRYMSDRIVVMYVGEVCETSRSEPLFEEMLHPYTEALVAANPGSHGSERHATVRLAGAVPDPANPPAGCRFHTRCHRATRDCGWEVDDIIRHLELQGLLDGLTDITRTRGAAQLAFRTPEDARAAAEGMHAPSVPSVLRAAMSDVHIDGSRVELAFQPPVRVSLEEVRPGHLTSCLLYTSQGVQMRSERLGRKPLSPA